MADPREPLNTVAPADPRAPGMPVKSDPQSGWAIPGACPPPQSKGGN